MLISRTRGGFLNCTILRTGSRKFITRGIEIKKNRCAPMPTFNRFDISCPQAKKIPLGMFFSLVIRSISKVDDWNLRGKVHLPPPKEAIGWQYRRSSPDRKQVPGPILSSNPPNSSMISLRTGHACPNSQFMNKTIRHFCHNKVLGNWKFWYITIFRIYVAQTLSGSILNQLLSYSSNIHLAALTSQILTVVSVIPRTRPLFHERSF